MHDRNGTPLKVGDEVLIPAVITDLSPGEEFCNVTLKTISGRRPDKSKETISAINTGVLVKYACAAATMLLFVTMSFATDVWKFGNKNRSGDVWVVTSTAAAPEPAKPAAPMTEVANAMDEVNAARAKRGLAPFKVDELLCQGALNAARERARRHQEEHLTNDFLYLPPGAKATHAGCGALTTDWGWGTCCTYDSYTTAGAAWVMGTDNRRYMHIFVRNDNVAASKPAIYQQTTEPVYYAGDDCPNGTCATGSCSTGSCAAGGCATGNCGSFGRRGRWR